MSELERFDVLWDFAEEKYSRDYHPHGRYVRAGLVLERIRELESINVDLYKCCAELLAEYEGAGYCPVETLIVHTKAVMAKARGEEPPR